MKRVCKNTNIEDRKLIERAVLLCLNPAKKRQRGDTRKLFARLLNVSVSTARSALRNRDELYFKGVDLVVDMLQKRIKEKKLHLPLVTQQLRRDPSSGKNRKISVLSIEQLLLDHVAVLGLSDLCKRIGEFQVSSIPKRRGSVWEESYREMDSQEIKQICREVGHQGLLWQHKS